MLLPSAGRSGGSIPSRCTSFAVVAQSVEHSLGKGEVVGSNPANSTSSHQIATHFLIVLEKFEENTNNHGPSPLHSF